MAQTGVFPRGLDPAPPQPLDLAMAGRIKQLIDELCPLRARGNPGVIYFVHANLMLHGINPQTYHDASPDDKAVERTLEDMIAGFNRRRARAAR